MTSKMLGRLAPVFAIACMGFLGCSADDGGGTGGRGGSGGSTGGSAGSGGSTGGSGGAAGSGGTTGGAAGSTGGSGGSAGSAGGGSDAGTGTLSCKELQACQNACRNQSCRDMCFAQGTAAAQQLTTQLSECIEKACSAPDAGSSCRTDVQCAQDGACRVLNETCVEVSPDPDCP